jgi:hypothetical protein
MTVILAASLGTELLKIVVGALVAVLAAGLIGTRLTYRWDEMRRLRESDHAAREAFYTAYAQFFATWKQWETVKRKKSVGPTPVDINWQLLCDASTAEGNFEALLVKLASERVLDLDACILLASFRQAYQSLRETIRDDKPLNWWLRGDSKPARDYRAFKALAEYFGSLLAEDRTSPSWWRLKRAQPDVKDAIKRLYASTQRIDDWAGTAEEKLNLSKLHDASLLKGATQ